MEGKINKNGNLEIKRGDKYKLQVCVYDNTACDDWCPQFGEPEIYSGDKTLPGQSYLTICQSRLLKFDKFVDERGKTEDKT